MIAANELRIGNWIFQEYNYPITVGIIYSHFFLECEGSPRRRRLVDCNPIPLAPDILEKAGFERKGELLFDHKDGNYIRSSGDQYWYYFKTTGNLRSIQYLHELQNLYFALNRNELNITL